MKTSWQRSFLQLDASLSQRIAVAERPGGLRRLAIIFAHSGDSWFWLIGLALLWWLGHTPWNAIALAMAFGIVLTAGIVFILKFTIRRPRPAGEWGSIYRRTDPHSFPSGHAARAAMLAVVAIGLGPLWFGIGIAVWAILVILARVAMGVHYLSDVIAGGILGICSGLFVLSLVTVSAPRFLRLVS